MLNWIETELEYVQEPWLDIFTDEVEDELEIVDIAIGYDKNALSFYGRILEVRIYDIELE